MRTPFRGFICIANESGDTGSLTKKAGRNIPGSIRQTDTICRQRAMRTVRHDLLYFYGSERQTRGREAGAVLPWATTSDKIMRLPYSYSPSVQP